MAEAPVLKVYSADEDGFKYIAYLVKWNGFDVIVDDPLARTQFREGEIIHFMVQNMMVCALR